MIGVCRWQIPSADFERLGWRLPFLFSIFLLAFSIYIRIKLRETPVFLRMKSEGRSSAIPVWESFFRWPNNKLIVLSLLGATAGQGVVWYTAQFYTLFFLTITLHLDYLTTYLLVGSALAIGMPFFIFFGWLSDKIGRLKIILAGCLIASATTFPLFHVLSYATNPALVEFQAANPITLRVDQATCNVHIFVGPWSSFSLCDQVTDFLTKSGLSFTRVDTPGSTSVSVFIDGQTVNVSLKDKDTINTIFERALFAAGYPGLTWKYANGEPAVELARRSPVRTEAG